MAKQLPVASMTGFARQEGGDETLGWTWELKSVNGRGLDVRCRLPSGYESLDQPVRRAAAERFTRGNLQIGLTYTRKAGSRRLRINRELLAQLAAATQDLEQSIEAAPARLDGLLNFPGIVETDDEDHTAQARDERERTMLDDLEAALTQLEAARRGEGEKLLDVATGHIERIESSVARASELAASQPAALKGRLDRQLKELLDDSQTLPEERIAQEIALLATKADVREELDRLTAHLESAHGLLAGGGPVGRRLDFLCQELNREANTLCSKSSDLELTQIGLSLKSTIEQLREQIQNIE